ncbi:hypothetical protein CPT_Merlin137 [Citrobacter phage Merlin]|uniref:Uncharacterized protein n=1 Tax=Citrobacter phage Merlin TaxID=1675602 RepID=A0A0K1LNL2_9CAUD|nr:hypothetical protein CPT_Merlin137 [Citrobacter phage Merlin]AKU43783.1 hypothetical protein CPT_Merlin137 [Citrobacter phage Merlin]
MSVAIYVESESGDEYLYSFGDGESEEAIKDELERQMEMFSPMCNYMISISSGTSPSVDTRLEEFMSELFDKSWKFERENV